VEVNNFYSNGKFLISGEYLVLNGAVAFAIPLKLGQELIVRRATGSRHLKWSTNIKGNLWFNATFDLKNNRIIKSNNDETGNRLLQILAAVNELNSDFISSNYSSEIICNIDFDIDWGLGSSSTLLSNISYWANLDPYTLHFKLSAGSGYDIACARSKEPVLYQLQNRLPVVKAIDFNPSFKDNIYFVYLGQKQNSEKSVAQFKKSIVPEPDQIDTVSGISLEMAATNSYSDFSYCVKYHEAVLSKILRTKRIKDEHFNDFDGEIKSLGAWGGDFIMAVSELSHEKVKKYFFNKNLKTIFTFDEIILK